MDTLSILLKIYGANTAQKETAALNKNDRV